MGKPSTVFCIVSVLFAFFASLAATPAEAAKPKKAVQKQASRVSLQSDCTTGCSCSSAKPAPEVTWGAPNFLKAPGRPIIIAHRGARSIAPENTFIACEIAFKRCGAEMLEIDVHPSKDGVPMVIHDESLERTTNVKEKFPDRAPYWVSQFSAAELMALDAGSWFVQADPFGQIKAGTVSDTDIAHFSSGRVRIPTLAAILELVKHHDGWINIEIKNFPGYYPGFSEAILDVVRRSGIASRVVFSSFDHEVVLRLKTLCPDIPVGALCDQPVTPLKAYVKDILGAVAWNPDKDVLGLGSLAYVVEQSPKGLRPDLVREAHDAGLAVYVWTVNKPRDLQTMIDLGVDGVFTDFPHTMRDLLKAR
jgi:glycerophosphoryl diester phosphodiesterase